MQRLAQALLAIGLVQAQSVRVNILPKLTTQQLQLHFEALRKLQRCCQILPSWLRRYSRI